MYFSLILATVGRTEEIQQLLNSLCAQTYQKFEVIVVDQNPGDGLTHLLAEYADRLSIRHIRSARGASRARNVGLHHTTGDIIGFPDDDCWYAPDLLESVVRHLSKHCEWSGVTGRAVTRDGEPSSGRWDPWPGAITRYNVWGRAIEFSFFLRKSAIYGKRFDESLGVGAGTRWGAGEGSDLLLQVLQDGFKIYYEPTLTVNHPEWGKAPYTPTVCAKARSYGSGIGRVLRKHNYPLWAVAYQLIRPLGGAVLAVLNRNFGKSRYHWAIFAGRAAGWMRLPARDKKGPELASQQSAEKEYTAKL
jgi:GT2 family glycosyltransferase